MAALNSLSFAVQAVDVTARSALGLHRNYRDRRDERAQRLSEYLSTIDEYEAAIQGLNIGGGPPAHLGQSSSSAASAENDECLHVHASSLQ